MRYRDYDGNEIGTDEEPPDWDIWIAESTILEDEVEWTYCRDGRQPLPEPETTVPDPDAISINDLTDALADASDAVSSNAEDVATLSDAIAELSEIVAALVPTETESEE